MRWLGDRLRAGCVVAALLALLPSSGAAASAPVDWHSGLDLLPLFERLVARRLSVPPDDAADYARRLDEMLAQSGVALMRPQFLLLVDRNPSVQAALLFWRSELGHWHLIGAAPATTGGGRGFEHFVTPVGVFAHATDNPDFRAEGTRNELGLRGYGVAGMRVFDFGWVPAERGWDRGRWSPMRLQVHATDPARLEPRLGRAGSKGCIRIAADLNHLLDHYGLLDADYEAQQAQGRAFWVLAPDRRPTPWSGRYLVVVDSARSGRPAWAVPATAR